MKRMSRFLAAIGAACLLTGATGPVRQAQGVMLSAAYGAEIYSVNNAGWWDFGAFDFTASDWVPGSATSGYGNRGLDCNLPQLDRWYGLVVHDYDLGCLVQVTWVFSDALVP